jgi:hypothetical protein
LRIANRESRIANRIERGIGAIPSNVDAREHIIVRIIH